MKKLIIIMLGLLTMAFFFNDTKIETPPVPDNPQFLIGVMGCGNELDNGNKAALNMNLWHMYANNKLRHGWKGISSDSVWAPVDSYSYAIDTQIVSNHNNGFLTYYDRPKWDYLAYKQRSDYQCEPISEDQDKLWFYAFAVHNGVPYQDIQWNDGKMVLFCGQPTDANPHYVVSGLKANREQCYGFWGGDDNLYNWYVKPRIRISPSDVQSFPNKPVCRLEIYNWDSSRVDSITIFAKSFAPWDSANSYTGRYREEYYYSFPGRDSSARIIEGNTFKNNIPYEVNVYNWDVPCGIDYRIYWYDEIEMWIDLIRVENKKAYDLYSTDPENEFHNTYEGWIRDEVEIASRHPGYVSGCYIEEFELSHLPCIKYVNEKIKYWSEQYHINPPLSLIINANEGMLIPNIPYLNKSGDQWRPLTPQFLYNNVTNYVGGYKEYVNTNYPLDGSQYGGSEIPSTLPACTNGGCSWNEDLGILANSYSPEVYNYFVSAAFIYR